MTPTASRPSPDRAFRARAASALAVAGLMNLGAWGWALLAFDGRADLLATAGLVYALGLRHAVDADHIAAIDNVARRLAQGERPSASVGLWFALGHSGLVVAATLVVILAAGRLSALPGARELGGIVATCVSGGFLLAVAAMNLQILRGALGDLRRLRAGEAPCGPEAAARGPLSRLFGPLFERIGRPWHMAPLGVLFGLGFDTATEVALFGLAAAQAGSGLGLGAALAFPALFAAGMSLVDTADGALMTGAYRWALDDPGRKLRCNLALTLMSIAAAVLVGAVQVAALAAETFGLRGVLIRAAEALASRFDLLGLSIVVAFAAAWALAAALVPAGGRDARAVA
ncbi:hypothetical protein [uncultured Albimonas sp.]|uniref:HoxN/HupN/NixA family nickel/cobalt transporter n=1 Tax=uncultured Albimonas sp. TaxID=1331701 RepID=UPI0030EDE45D|tara:strand:+ start:1348 stop:2379 length:1032 start_codon:yes stop_codon:yes gene_type:complete